MRSTPIKQFESARLSPKGKFKTVKSSILTPETTSLAIVLNVNNLAGKTTSPMLAVFDKKWGKVRAETKGWFANKTGAYKLGAITTIAVQSDVWIANMLCQDEQSKTDLKGLEACLKSVCSLAKEEKASVHVSSLLTSEIPELKEMLETHIIGNGINVFLYE